MNIISDKITFRASKVYYLCIKAITTQLHEHKCVQTTSMFTESHAKAYVLCMLHKFHTQVVLNLSLVCTVGLGGIPILV